MKISINHKITIIFTIVIAVILLGVFIYLNSSLRDYTYQRIKTNLLKELKLATSFLEHLDKKDYKVYELDRIADEIGKDLGTRATVIGLNGVVYGDTDLNEKHLYEIENHIDRPEVQDALTNEIGESTRFSTTIKKNMLYMAATFGEDKKEGIIRLSMPLSEIESISAHLKKILVLSLVIAFIFSIVISYIVTILISRPIKEISYTAQSISNGDFSKRSSVGTQDEIGELSKSINFMSDQIKSKIDEVTSNKSRLEAVLLSMFEGVIVVDSDGDILLINKALKDLLAIKENPEGKSALEVIRNIEIQDMIDTVLKKQTDVKSHEISVFAPETKTFMVHAVPVMHEEKPEGAVLVFHDITELRQLENIRKEFVANVSHELRTPVSNIKGYAETLMEGALDDKKHAKEFLKIIHSDSERLAALINDLLDLSKIESGKLLLQLRPYSIKAIIKNILSKFDRLTENKSIKIAVIISDSISKVLIDENKIAQVLFNLIDNAVKYTQGGGNIIINAKEIGDFIKVDVSDTGIGISQEHIPRLFERFYRIDKARSRELGGTGLGLSIVKHIIKAHNGEISVESIVGKGSTFSFTLPKA